MSFIFLLIIIIYTWILFFQLPYVSQVQMSPVLVKVILLTEFGIHSDLNTGGSAGLSIHPNSLEKYIKNLDMNSKYI